LCNFADRLKIRPPENPAAGFSVTLRKNNLKKKNYKKPLTPKSTQSGPELPLNKHGFCTGINRYASQRHDALGHPLRPLAKT